MLYKAAILSITLAMALQACGGSSQPDDSLSLAEANVVDPQPNSEPASTIHGFWEVTSPDDSSTASYWQIDEAGALTTFDYLTDAIPLDDEWSLQYCYVQQDNDISPANNNSYQIAGPLDQLNNYASDYESMLSNNGALLTVNPANSSNSITLERIEDLTQTEEFFICPTQAPNLAGFNSGIDKDNRGTNYSCRIYNLLNPTEEPQKSNLKSWLDHITNNPYLSYTGATYASTYANGSLGLGYGSEVGNYTVAYAKTIKFHSDRLENDRLSFIHESQTINATTNKPEFLQAFHCSRIDRTTAYLGLWQADSRGFRSGDSYAYPEPLKRYWHFDQIKKLTIYTHHMADDCYHTATGRLSYDAFNPRVVDIVDDQPGFSDFYHTSVIDNTKLSVKNKFDPDCDEYGYSCTYVDHIDETYTRATDINSTDQLPVCGIAPEMEEPETGPPTTNLTDEDRTRPEDTLFISDQSELKDNGADNYSNSGNPPQRVDADKASSWPGLRYGNLLVSNNPWNSSAATYPDSYQEISLFESTNGYGVKFDWDWGAEGDTAGSPFSTRSFPEVIFGTKSRYERSGTFSETGLPEEIVDLPEMGIFFDYDYEPRRSASSTTSGTDSEFNVSITSLFHNTCDINRDGSSTDTAVFELMVWLKTGDRKPSGEEPHGPVTIDYGNSYFVYTKATNPNYIAFVAESDIQNGSIGFDQLVTHAQNNATAYGINRLKDTDCLGHISLGTEIWHGAGSFFLNSYHISRSYFDF